VRFPSFATPRPAADPVPVARPSAEDLRAAREAAYAEGRAEGRAAAFAEWTPRLDALAAALEAAGTALRQRREELATELGAHVTEIVLTLARKVLDRELTSGEAPVRATAEQLARRLTAGGAIGVRVAPGVAEVLTAWRGTGVALGDVVIRADASLGAGDFVVETDAGFLDGRIATQLAEAARALAEPTS
jgi:flagellar biosynthesis/type III secretory pathway protein FliH